LSVLLVACYFDVSHYPHLSNLVPPAIKSSHFQLVGMKRTVLPARRMRDLVKRFSCPLGDERAKRLAIDLWLFQPGLPSCFSFFFAARLRGAHKNSKNNKRQFLLGS